MALIKLTNEDGNDVFLEPATVKLIHPPGTREGVAVIHAEVAGKECIQFVQGTPAEIFARLFQES